MMLDMLFDMFVCHTEAATNYGLSIVTHRGFQPYCGQLFTAQVTMYIYLVSQCLIAVDCKLADLRHLR